MKALYNISGVVSLQCCWLKSHGCNQALCRFALIVTLIVACFCLAWRCFWRPFPPLQQTSSAWQISLPLLTSPDAATGKRSIAPGWVMMPSFAEWFLRFAVVASCVWVKIPYRVVLPLWHSGSGGCLLVCLWIWRNILRHSEQLFYLGSLRLEAGMN